MGDCFPAEFAAREKKLIEERRGKWNADRCAEPVPVRELPPCTQPPDPLPTREGLPGDCVGLALSGGGIRSATFCLGFVQMLCQHGLLRAFDYLSTVSGGGYVGSFIGSTFARQTPELLKAAQPIAEPTATPPETPIPEPPAVIEKKLGDIHAQPSRWLRQTANYLTLDGSDTLRTVTILLREWLITHCVTLTFIVFIMCLLKMATYYAPELSGGLLQFIHSHVRSIHVAAYSEQSRLQLAWILAAAVLLFFFIPSAILLVFSGFEHKKWLLTFLAIFLATVVLMGPTQSSSSWLASLNPMYLASTILLLFGILGWGLYARLCMHFGKQKVPGGTCNVQEYQYRFRNQLTLPAEYGLLITGLLVACALIDWISISLLPLSRAGILKSSASFYGVISTIIVAARPAFLALQKFMAPSESEGGSAASGSLSKLAIMAVALGLIGFELVLVNTLIDNAIFLNERGNVLSISQTATTKLDNELQEAKLELGRAASRGPAAYALAQADITTLTQRRATFAALADVPVTFTNFYFHIDNRALAKLLLASGILSALCAAFIPILNLTSQASYYRSRIVRTFMGASNPRRGDEHSARAAVAGDDIMFRDYEPHAQGGPLHLINITINETIESRTHLLQPDRKGTNLAVTPVGLTVGVRHHAKWNDGKSYSVKGLGFEYSSFKEFPSGQIPFHVFDEQQVTESMSVGQWIGISGAAFGPGMGAQTSLFTSILLAWFNIRIGYWWDSSGKEFSSNGVGMRIGSLRSIARQLFPVQMHLLDEYLGEFYGPAARYWYLSDGGHFDNTGLYELIRRRVPLMLCCDCGQDPRYELEDISNLIIKARVDLKANVRLLSPAELTQLKTTWPAFPQLGSFFDLQALTGKDKSCPKMTLAEVRYENSKQRSFILFIKPALAYRESIEVQFYGRTHPPFPQQSTLDQFFSDTQWESYRRLGEETALELIKGFALEATTEAQKRSHADYLRRLASMI